MLEEVLDAGTAASTRIAYPTTANATAPSTPSPNRMPTAAPAPAATIAEGEVTARATRGVKKRSLKLIFHQWSAAGARPCQKLLTTAVNTAPMVVASEAA